MPLLGGVDSDTPQSSYWILLLSWVKTIIAVVPNDCGRQVADHDCLIFRLGFSHMQQSLLFTFAGHSSEGLTGCTPKLSYIRCNSHRLRMQHDLVVPDVAREGHSFWDPPVFLRTFSTSANFSMVENMFFLRNSVRWQQLFLASFCSLCPNMVGICRGDGMTWTMVHFTLFCLASRTRLETTSQRSDGQTQTAQTCR